MSLEATPATPVSNSERVAKNTGFYLVAQVLGWLSGFVAIGVSARAFDPDLIGKMIIADTIRGIVTGYLALSMENYLVKEIGRDSSKTAYYVNAMIGLRLLLLVPTFLICLFWFWLLKPTPLLWMFAGFFLAQIPLNFFTGIAASVLSGREEGKRIMNLGILQTVVAFCTLFFIRFGVQVYLGVTLVTQYGMSLVYLNWLRAIIPLKPSWNIAIWKQMIQGSLPFFANNIVLQTYGTITVFTLRHFLDDGAVAVYSQANRLTGTLLFFPTALGMALLPSLTRLAENSPDQIRRVQARVFSLLIVLGVPSTLLTIGLATPFCHLLYGSTKWAAVPEILQIYALALLPLYVVSTMYQFLIAKGKNGIWVWFLLGSIVVNVLCNCLLIPLTQRLFDNGVIGAALSTVIAESLSAVCAIRLLGEGIFTRESVQRLLKTFVAGSVMALVLYLTHRMFIVIPFCAGLTVFLLIGWKLQILEPEEQEKLSGYLSRFLKKRPGKNPRMIV